MAIPVTACFASILHKYSAVLSREPRNSKANEEETSGERVAGDWSMEKD